MKKGFLDGALMTAIAFLLFLAGVFAASFIKDPPTKSEVWAAWVQAVGSIAAIVGAYVVGERQAKASLENAMRLEALAVKRKQGAFLAIAAAAHQYAMKVKESIENLGGVNALTISLAYDEEKLGELINAMSAVPLHEIGVPEAVTAWLTMKDSLRQFEKAAGEYFKHIRVMPILEKKVYSPRSSLPLHHLIRTIDRQYSKLAEAIRGS